MEEEGTSSSDLASTSRRESPSTEADRQLLLMITQNVTPFADDDDDGDGDGDGSSVSRRLGLPQVPNTYFKRDFNLADRATFEEVLSFFDHSVAGDWLSEVNQKMSQLLHNADPNFALAQGVLKDLVQKSNNMLGQIRDIRNRLKKALEVIDRPAGLETMLYFRRLLELIRKVSVTSKLLRPLVGVGDCQKALDYLQHLQDLLDRDDDVPTLICFRGFQDRLTDMTKLITAILSEKFLDVALKDPDFEVAKEDGESSWLAEGTPAYERLRDSVLGLLRTAQLPAVLKSYQLAIATDVGTAVENVVAEQLALIVAQPPEPADAGADASLKSKLRSLSSDSFLQLLRAISTVVQERHLVQTADIKDAITRIICSLDCDETVKHCIEWIVGKMDCYNKGDLRHAEEVGDIASKAAQDTGGFTLRIAIGAAAWEGPDGLPPRYTPQRRTPPRDTRICRVPSFRRESNDNTSPSNMHKKFWIDVSTENTEAVSAACEAVDNKWEEILQCRALIPRDMRVKEVGMVEKVTKELAEAAEQIGGYRAFGALESLKAIYADHVADSDFLMGAQMWSF